MSNLSPIKLLSTISIPDDWVEKLRRISNRVQIQINPVGKSEEIPAEVWAETEVLYTLNVLPSLEQVPNLRWVQFHRSSVEHVRHNLLLNTEEIVFTTLSGANALQSAEFALMSLLTLGHQIPDILSHQRKNEWDTKRWRQYQPVELRGSTVGIVGYGSVGRELARLLQPFDVKILAAKFDVMHPEDTGYIPEGKGDPGGHLFTRLYPFQALASMLKECDFVVLTLPLTDQTQNLLGKTELEAIKPNSFLINLSDRHIVDMDALVNVLQNKHLKGAMLDVFHDEPPPSDHPLWKMSNVILTPRTAWKSTQNFDRAMIIFAENLTRYTNGTGLLNRYNPHRGY